MESKAAPTEQKLAYYAMPFRTQRTKHSTARVFIIFFHPSTSVTAMGGAEKRFVETLKYFCARKRLEISVLESSPNLLARPEITCKNFFLSSGFHGKGWLSTYLEWIFWLSKAFIRSFSLSHRIKPNAILVPNNTLPNLFMGYIISFVLGSPLLVVVHHIDIPFHRAGLSKDYSLYGCYRSIKYSRLVSLGKTIASYIMLSALKKVRGIIAVSNFTAEVLRNSGVSNVKIFVSGNAVDFDFIDNIKPHSNEKTYDGVFVGRIAKEKGIFDLLTIWRKVVEVKADAKLLIIGSGLELADVKEKIVDSGLEDKIFVKGHCSDMELYSLLKSSKVFIFPSLFEGWGIAVAEALACGLPVVAYNIPALRENFGKCESVFLIDVKNLEKMAWTFLEILSLSEEKLGKLGHSSKVYSRQFVWEDIAKMDLGFLTDYLDTLNVHSGHL